MSLLLFSGFSCIALELSEVGVGSGWSGRGEVVPIFTDYTKHVILRITLQVLFLSQLNYFDVKL